MKYWSWNALRNAKLKLEMRNILGAITVKQVRNPSTYSDARLCVAITWKSTCSSSWCILMNERISGISPHIIPEVMWHVVTSPKCHRVVTASTPDINILRPFVIALPQQLETRNSFGTHSRCWRPRQRLATFLNSLKKFPIVGNHWRWWQHTDIVLAIIGNGGQCGGNPPQPSVASTLPA